MCCYLWARLFQGQAYRCQQELQLHGAAAPGKRIACQVCGGDVNMVPEGIAAHLLSPSHVRNLVRRTPNLAGHLQAGETPAVLHSLCQVIELDSGRRLTLCHFPLEVIIKSDPPGGGREQNPFAPTAPAVVAAPAPAPARTAAAPPAAEASWAWHQGGGAGALAADGARGSARVGRFCQELTEVVYVKCGDEEQGAAAEAARRSAGPAEEKPPVVFWERTQDDTRGAYWTRNSDGWWFCEGDETWQQFMMIGWGPCWWHKQQGIWFVAKDGRDMGVWIG